MKELIKKFKNLVNNFISRINKPHEKIIFNVFLIVFYGFIYKFISYLDEKSFSHKLDYKDSFYFSSITNFTLGYGDILPVSPLAKFVVVIHSFTFWMIAIS